MRLVLCDTSLWISAIQFEGIPLEALRHAIYSDTLLTCRKLEDEIVRILVWKFRHPEPRVRAQLRALLENAVRVTISGSLSGVCRDPKDDFILECAATGKADLIVTGDKDLVALETYKTVKIITPRQYLDEARSGIPVVV